MEERPDAHVKVRLEERRSGVALLARGGHHLLAVGKASGEHVCSNT